MPSIPKFSGTYQAETDASPNSLVLRSSGGDVTGTIVYGENGLVSEGHLDLQILAATTSQILDDEQTTVLMDATSGALTVTLPPASGVADRVYVIQKTDTSANAVTVDGDSAETIAGLATWLLYNQGDTVAIQSDGTNWAVLWWKASMAVLTQTGAALTVSSQPTPITYLCDTTSNTITATLPAAASSKGMVRNFIKIHASNSMTLDANASENINGATTLSVTDIYDARNIVCNGTAWYVLNGFG